MFLQKLPYDELHQVIEFTQLLIDFLSLPTHAKWRDQVVARGRREAEAPAFYKGMFDMRQQLDKFEQQLMAEEAIRLEGLDDDEKAELQDRVDKIDEILDNPPEVEVQLHNFLLDTAVHTPVANPETQLHRIMHDHDDDNDEADDEASDVSFTSVDSAIPVPTNQSNTASGGLEGSAVDPLWRRIDGLRSRAFGLLDSLSTNDNNAPNNATRPGYTPGQHGRQALNRAGSDNGTELSLDNLDEDLARFETTLRETTGTTL